MKELPRNPSGKILKRELRENRKEGLMNFEITEEQLMLKEGVRKIAKDLA